MLVRLFALAGALTLTCCSASDQDTLDTPLRAAAGAPEAPAQAGDAQVDPEPPPPVPETAGGATVAAAGGSSAGVGGTGSQPEPLGGSGGTDAPGGNAGGPAGQGGNPSLGGSESGTSGTGGSTPIDPLDPTPAPGCPGYLKIFIPHGTCVWLHGQYTIQNAECDFPEPPQRHCGTMTALSKDLTAIVSESAEITRLEFGPTGCPKQCSY